MHLLESSAAQLSTKQKSEHFFCFGDVWGDGCHCLRVKSYQGNYEGKNFLTLTFLRPWLYHRISFMFGFQCWTFSLVEEDALQLWDGNLCCGASGLDELFIVEEFEVVSLVLFPQVSVSSRRRQWKSSRKKDPQGSLLKVGEWSGTKAFHFWSSEATVLRRLVQEASWPIPSGNNVCASVGGRRRRHLRFGVLGSRRSFW